MPRVVVVFEGHNELEAQMARDVLQSAMIPVFHTPSVSTGVFGMPLTTNVSVPEEYVEGALEALEEAGLAAAAVPARRGVAAVNEATSRLLPFSRAPVGRLRIVIGVLSLIALVVALLFAFLHRAP